MFAKTIATKNFERRKVCAQRTGRDTWQRKIKVNKAVDLAARAVSQAVDSPAMTGKAAGKKLEVVEVRKVAEVRKEVAAVLAEAIDKHKRLRHLKGEFFKELVLVITGRIDGGVRPVLLTQTRGVES